MSRHVHDVEQRDPVWAVGVIDDEVVEPDSGEDTAMPRPVRAADHQLPIHETPENVAQAVGGAGGLLLGPLDGVRDPMQVGAEAGGEELIRSHGRIMRCGRSPGKGSVGAMFVVPATL